MHFNLLRSSYPTVSLYADGYELLASGAFLTPVSAPKNKFFDTLLGRPIGAARILFAQLIQKRLEKCFRLLCAHGVFASDQRVKIILEYPAQPRLLEIQLPGGGLSA